MNLKNERVPFYQYLISDEGPTESCFKITWLEIVAGVGIYEYLDKDSQFVAFEISPSLQTFLIKEMAGQYIYENHRCEIFSVFKELIFDYLSHCVSAAEFKLMMRCTVDEFKEAMDRAIFCKKILVQTE